MEQTSNYRDDKGQNPDDIHPKDLSILNPCDKTQPQRARYATVGSCVSKEVTLLLTNLSELVYKSLDEALTMVAKLLFIEFDEYLLQQRPHYNNTWEYR